MKTTNKRRWLNLIKREDREKNRINNIPITKNTTSNHWWGLTKIAYELCAKQHMEVILEARFIAGGRADLYLPEIGVVIEVLHTETLEDFKKKVAKQYAGIPVKVLYVTTKELIELGAPEALELAFSRYK